MAKKVSFSQYYDTENEQEILQGIKNRLSKISSPTWQVAPNLHGDPFVAEYDRGSFGRVAGLTRYAPPILELSSSPDDYGRSNMEFVASAPTDVDFLLQLLEQKDAEIARLKGNN